MQNSSRLISWCFILLVTGLPFPGRSGDKLAGYHGAVGRNLVLNPDFELGGQGWLYVGVWPKSAKSFTKHVRVPARILPTSGMEGGACLYLPERATSTRSFCFPLKSKTVYTISMYLRAPEGKSTGDVSLIVINPDWRVGLWKKQGGIGKTWKQYTWKLEWKHSNHQEKAYLDIGSRSGVLVDRVLVCEGDDPTYEASVMMGLAGKRHPYFVRGRDEAKMDIRIAPGTLCKGKAKVKAVARDAWGKTVWRRELDATLDKAISVPVDLPTNELGNFHVEFNAYQSGKVVGRGVSRYAIIDPPAKAQTSPGKPSPFGICQSLFAWAPWANKQYAQIVKDTGPQFNRFFAKAPRDLRYPWPKSFIERQVEMIKPAHVAGIELMACIQFFPGTFHCGNNSRMPTQAELDLYGKCVKQYVKELSPYVRYWEIFNEPDLWRAKDGKRAFSPEKYLEIQKVAYKAIKDVDPKLVVVCNALNTFRWKWMERWFAAGGCKYMDFFSFHPYRSHPDQLNAIGVYADMSRARKMLDRYGGKHIGMINSEQLYGCHLFSDRKTTDEVRRGYYVDNDHELEAASRQVRNLIHHQAIGATCCPFTFREEFAYLGPSDSILVYDALPAYNATTRFLAASGRGKPVDMGESLRAFVFPNASGGPLVAVWTPIADAKGQMKLQGKFQAFDMMGNRRQDMEKGKVVHFSTDPVWVSYSQPQTFESLKTALQNAEVRGLGEALRVDFSITGINELTAHLSSLTNQPVNGTIELKYLPAGWKAMNPSVRFDPIETGKSRAVRFELKGKPVDSSSFEVTALVKSNRGTLERTQTLRPFRCTRKGSTITVDGDPSDWKDVPFTVLGDDHVSKRFNHRLSRRDDSDLSAKVALAWTDDSIACLLVVTDDQHVGHSKPGDAWQADSVQLYFDQLGDATPGDAKTGDDISYILTLNKGKATAWISKGAEGNYKGAANQREGLSDPEAKLAIKRIGKQTVYELVLPQQACLPSISLKRGKVFGFSLLINDNDGKGRKTGLTLAPKGKEPHNAPTEYRDAIIE